MRTKENEFGWRNQTNEHKKTRQYALSWKQFVKQNKKIILQSRNTVVRVEMLA